MRNSLNPKLEIRGYLFVMTDRRLDTTKIYSEELKEIYTDLVFKTVIRRNTDIVKSQEVCADVFDFNPNSNGAKDYNAFVDEFLETAKS